MPSYKHSNFNKHGQNSHGQRKVVTTTTALATLFTLASGISQFKSTTAHTVKASTSKEPKRGPVLLCGLRQIVVPLLPQLQVVAPAQLRTVVVPRPQLLVTPHLVRRQLLAVVRTAAKLPRRPPVTPIRLVIVPLPLAQTSLTAVVPLPTAQTPRPPVALTTTQPSRQPVVLV